MNSVLGLLGLTGQRLPSIHLDGDGDYDFDIVGESHYQEALTQIAGPKTEEGVEFYCTAWLKCEDDNQYDKNAVAVFVNKMKVGHLDRDFAKAWRNAQARQGVSGQMVTVDAVIVGGWKRGDNEGHFGVKLDM